MSLKDFTIISKLGNQAQTKHSRAIAFSDGATNGGTPDGVVLEIDAREAFKSPHKKEYVELIQLANSQNN